MSNLRNCSEPHICQLATRPARLSLRMANKKNAAKCSIRQTQMPFARSLFSRILAGLAVEASSSRLSAPAVLSRMSPSKYRFPTFLTATRPSSEIAVTTIRTRNIAFSNSNNNPCVAVRQLSARMRTSSSNFVAFRVPRAVTVPLIQACRVGEFRGAAGL